MLRFAFMESSQSIAGECRNGDARTFTLGSGCNRLSTGPRQSWHEFLTETGGGFHVVARYGFFRWGIFGDNKRLGSIYVERRAFGGRHRLCDGPRHRVVIAAGLDAPEAFRAFGVRAVGGWHESQAQAEIEGVPAALVLVQSHLRDTGLRWTLDGLEIDATEPGDDTGAQ